jgi:hypothetical protein
VWKRLTESDDPSTGHVSGCSIRCNLRVGITMEYDLYHDESKQGGYWHGMLLVPRATRKILLAHLENVRVNTRYSNPIELKALSKYSGPRFRCIRAWMTLGVAALVQDFKNLPCHVYTGDDSQRAGTGVLDTLIRARFILFRVKDDHASMTGLHDHAAKIETTFRMGFKGGVHLFSKTSSDGLLLKSFHFDGYKHYGRRVDSARVIGRLGTLRDGVSVASDYTIDDESGNHDRSDCQGYDDCQLLQLADILVGGFRTILGESTHNAQRQVSAPLGLLAEKWNDGYARMKQSRWFGGFCLSECRLDDSGWIFSDVTRPTLQSQKFDFR